MEGSMYPSGGAPASRAAVLALTLFTIAARANTIGAKAATAAVAKFSLCQFAFYLIMQCLYQFNAV